MEPACGGHMGQGQGQAQLSASDDFAVENSACPLLAVWPLASFFPFLCLILFI